MARGLTAREIGKGSAMRTWIAAAAVVPLVAASAAHASTASTIAVQPSAAEKLPAVSNFMLPSNVPQFESRSPLQDGMIAQEELAPNAHLDLGLAPMLGRNIHSVRIEQEPVPTRNPGVTFVFKFPR